MDDEALADRLDAYEALLEQSQLDAFLHCSSLPDHPGGLGSSAESEQSGAQSEEDSDDGNEGQDDTYEDAGGAEGSVAWSQHEVNTFLRSLARHSRLRPDLIADDLRFGKSMAQVHHLISLFERRKKAIGRHLSSKSLSSYKELVRCPAAFEVSHEWITFEERAARQLQAWQEVQDADQEDGDDVQSGGIVNVSWDEQVSNVILWMRHTPLLDSNANHAKYRLHAHDSHQDVFGFSVGEAIGTMVGNSSRSRQKPVLTLSQFARDHCAPDFDKIRRRKESVTSFAIGLLNRAIELGLLWVCENSDEDSMDEKTLITRAGTQRLPSEARDLLFADKIVLVWCDSIDRRNSYEGQASGEEKRHTRGLRLMEATRRKAAMRLLNTLNEDELKGMYALLSASEPLGTTGVAQKNDSHSQQAIDDRAAVVESSRLTSKRKANVIDPKAADEDGKRARLAERDDQGDSEGTSDSDDSDALSESVTSIQAEGQGLRFAAYETIDDVAMRTRQRLLRFIAIGVHPRQVALHLHSTQHVGLFNFSACASFLTTDPTGEHDQESPQEQAKRGSRPSESGERSVSFRTLVQLRSSLELFIRRAIELLVVHAECSSFLTSRGHISADDISTVLLQMQQMDRAGDEPAHRLTSDIDLQDELTFATDPCEWNQFDPTSNLTDDDAGANSNSTQMERNHLEGIRTSFNATLEDDDRLNDEIDDEEEEEAQDIPFHLSADEARNGADSEAFSGSVNDVSLDAPDKQNSGRGNGMADIEKWRRVDEFDMQQSKKQQVLLWHRMGRDVPKEQTWYVSSESEQSEEDESDDEGIQKEIISDARRR